MAKKAGAGKLIIGHFSARYENTDLLVAEARSIFPETYPAEEGTIINI
jgi:ribonuclease Z